MSDNRAIGVFDSGMGGLTVLSALHRHLPRESTVYLGDTARVPYGARNPETITRYTLQCADALIKHTPLKMLVVACNTASAVALGVLKEVLDIPVIGVIEPTIKAAVKAGFQNVGVLATRATIDSKAYDNLLKEQGFKGQLWGQACPLFVPLAEEGMIEGAIAEQVAQLYLNQLPPHLDAIVLGCTHYPPLQPLLRKLYGNGTHFIQSGDEVAKEVSSQLDFLGFFADTSHAPQRRYCVTESPVRFRQVSEFFLGKPVLLEEVEHILVG